MNAIFIQLRRHLSLIVASVIVLGAYSQAKLPQLSNGESEAMAKRFHFVRLPMPDLPGYQKKLIRAVHPSLQPISAWISAVGGAAVALGDLDGDGLPNDLCMVDPRIDQVIVAPVPGTGSRYKPFVLSPSSLSYDSMTMAPMGCLLEDLNEDGLTDVLVYYWGRRPIAFLQKSPRRGHHLTERDFKAVEIIPGKEPWYTNAVTMADVDGDGHADIIIGNYFPDGAEILQPSGSGSQQMHNTWSQSSNGGQKHFLLWSSGTSGSDPTVVFREVFPEFSEAITRSWTLAVAAADVNGDLLPEIYFANDFGPDQFLYNRSSPGHLRFTVLKGRSGFATPKSFVLGQDSFKGMGVDFGDISNSGRLDIFVSNITANWGLMESNFVWLNNGHYGSMAAGVAPYIQASDDLGLSRSGWAWDSKLADFDNDGILEVIQATGYIKGEVNGWAALQSLATANDEIVRHPQFWPRIQTGTDLSGHDHVAFFARAADGYYYNIGDQLGIDAPNVTRGIAVADVDGDGALDFAVATQWGDSFFYHNVCNHCGAFLGLHLLRSFTLARSNIVVDRSGHPAEDTPGCPAIGAEAKVFLSNGHVLVGQVDGGNGHSGKRSPDLHFGLGNAIDQSKPVRVELNWRDGEGQVRKATVYLKPGWHTILLG